MVTTKYSTRLHIIVQKYYRLQTLPYITTKINRSKNTYTIYKSKKCFSKLIKKKVKKQKRG